MENIYGMKIHQVIIDGNMQILRVSGGWIYSVLGTNSVFVPFNNEFKIEMKEKNGKS
jgi:hypothetical protein